MVGRCMVIAALAWLVATVSAGQEPVVRYEMEVALDPASHRITGTQQVRWSNRSGVPTAELRWHLYLNAFAGPSTTFMQELAGQRFRIRGSADRRRGWIRITAIRLADGTDLLPGLEFQRPDDGNPKDFTVARLALPYEVLPGAAVELSIDFEAQLPEIVARTGYAGDFHLVAQFFPKLGVFQGERGWNCHQFHAASEFFADFGSYRVAVKVPADWRVGATGVEVEREVADGAQRVVFSADRVHDFAWCTAPASLMSVVEEDFDPGRDVPVVWLQRAADLLGVGAAQLELPPMHLRLLVPISQRPLADRMLRAIRFAVAWYGLHYGPYPYPQLTLVSPPVTAEEAAGMEYPTFITTGASLLMAFPPFDRVRWIEAVTVHEFGHQYFQGLVASNEFEETWLDEGLTSYTEAECLEALHQDGLVRSFPGPGPWTRKRLALASVERPLQIARWSWEFRSLSDFVMASFTKAALAMKTLEGLVGRERFARAMRAYVEQYRFRHPTWADLLSVFEQSTDDELQWFFDQAFRGDAEVDWSLLAVRDLGQRLPEGSTVDDVDRGDSAGDGGSDGTWQAVVEIGRLGEFVGPVTVALRFEDGAEERRSWDGTDRWVRWRLESQARLTQVVVDPDGAWALETERADNYWRARPDRWVARCHLWWLLDGLRLLGLGHMPWS